MFHVKVWEARGVNYRCGQEDRNSSRLALQLARAPASTANSHQSHRKTDEIAMHRTITLDNVASDLERRALGTELQAHFHHINGLDDGCRHHASKPTVHERFRDAPGARGCACVRHGRSPLARSDLPDDSGVGALSTAWSTVVREAGYAHQAHKNTSLSVVWVADPAFARTRAPRRGAGVTLGTFGRSKLRRKLTTPARHDPQATAHQRCHNRGWRSCGVLKQVHNVLAACESSWHSSAPTRPCLTVTTQRARSLSRASR